MWPELLHNSKMKPMDSIISMLLQKQHTFKCCPQFLLFTSLPNWHIYYLNLVVANCTCMKVDVRGTPKFQYSDSATHATLAIPATLCDHPPKKSHRVATPIDHPVCVAYCLPLPCHSPFYFCASLLPSYSTSTLFHILFPILSMFHILPLSLFRDPLLVAMHSVPYVAPLRLGSP